MEGINVILILPYLFKQELIFDVDVAFRFIIRAKEYLNCSQKLLDLKSDSN